MLKSPILISGIGRSGTSAVIKSLAEHPDIVKPERIGEAPFISNFINFLKQYENISDAREYHLKNYQLEIDSRAREFSRLLAMLQYGRDINTTETIGRYWIAKVSLTQDSHEKANEVLGDTRVVYVMRNGIEVVNSAKSFAGFADLSFEQLCQRWVGNIDQCRYVHTTRLCGIVRHHELVNDPQSVYDNLFDSLEIQWNDAPAKFIQTNLFNSSFDTTARLKSTATIFKNRLNCWDTWSGEEKATFIELCDAHMEEFEFQRPYKSSNVISMNISDKQEKISDSTNSFPTEKKFDVAVRMSMPLAQFDYYSNPSIKHNYLFMENPKVASTSILRVLQSKEHNTSFYEIDNPHERDNSPLPRMSSLAQIDRLRMKTSRDTYKFTFVRNPYFRLLSAYLSKISRSLQPKAEILSIIKGVDKNSITDLSEEISFAEFVDVVCSQDSFKMNAHWRCQVDQTLSNVIDYDFIGKFEQLDKDFLLVCNELFPGEKLNLPQASNKTGSATVATKYYDSQLKAKVYSKYYCDFHAFEYSESLHDDSNILLTNVQ